MEFIGKIVRKELRGLGVVKSFDPASALFEVLYEDGGSEKLELAQVAALVSGNAEVVAEKPRRGRKPKKRRRVGGKRGTPGEPGNVSQNLVRASVSNDEPLENESGFGNSEQILHANGNMIFSDEFRGNLREECRFGGESKGIGCVSGNLDTTDNSKDGLDLNVGFNLNLNYGSGSSSNFEGSVQKRDCIDLNLDLIPEDPDWNEHLSGVDLGGSTMVTQKRKRDFDLNLGVDEENEDVEGDDQREMKISTLVEMGQNKYVGANVEEKSTEGFSANGTFKEVSLKTNERIVVKGTMDASEYASNDACLGLVEGTAGEDNVSDGDLKANVSLEVLDASSFKDCKSLDVQMKAGLSEDGNTGTPGYEGDVGDSCKKGRGRSKRRKLSDNSATDIVLRRSARRGSSHNLVSSSISLCAAEGQSLSPVISATTEEKPILSKYKGSEEPCVPPPKPQLPQSSQNLNFDGIPVLDLFSVYSCLRSFSTLLFLSPFQLEDFAAAVKSTSPSSLIDCIHVSILHTMRKHLEYLSNEGSQPASDCLRSLNWDLLDWITWPVFMVEYLLIHGSGLKPGLDLSQLNIFKIDYYKQPASLKVEILRCLCDDMMEVEDIRSELNRRSLAAEPVLDFDRNVNFEISKRRRAAMDVSGSSCTTMEVEDTNDWNSDECCLCKMDGNLICCDGCPAAYHSRCVGVASDLLPDGDWYCPECAIDRHKPWTKLRKSVRGAELLGIDPHGRPYFSSCGYLLISDDCDTGNLLNYYHKNDLHTVIEVLKSSDISYYGIVRAIYKHWDIPIGSDKVDGSLDSVNHSVSSDMAIKVYVPAPLGLAETYGVNDEAENERKQDEDSFARDSGNRVGILGSVQMMQMSSSFQNFRKDGLDNSTFAGSLTSAGLNVRVKDNTDSDSPDHGMTMINMSVKGNTLQVQRETEYMNCYSFAQTASLVAEELMPTLSEKINNGSIKSEEAIIAAQMKAISKQSTKFCWPNLQNINVEVSKEKCGWCFSCKVPSDDRDCLFNMTMGPVEGGSNSEVVALQTKTMRKGHLVDIICYMLYLEDRLRGLLMGPWLNPHHSELWRKNVLQASDVASVKYLLLNLESNLRHRALSAEWFKHVDSVITMGSATHFSAPSVRTSSKQGIARKRARCSDSDPNPTPNAAGGLGLFWWRGGRLSRQVFSWKVLPRSLVSKAARQAGCSKIPGILYPENSEYAKRSKYVVWRAAVEASTSSEQLAFQVRQLDLNIKWDDIENTHPLSMLDKESKKSVRLFRKVILRRKCIEGELVKYLLDFGKRKAIPDVVAKFGSILEESSSERKRYWLEEAHVPLHLLKNFEEKRIARKGNNTKPGKLMEVHRIMKRDSKERGFSYLFSKAERLEYCLCGHCNKDVLIREAVNCLYCKRSFHRRHVKKSPGAVLSECTYTCHRCQDKSSLNIEERRDESSPNVKKVDAQKGKKSLTQSKSVKFKSSKGEVRSKQAKSKNKKKGSAFSSEQQIQSESNKSGDQAVVPLRRSARQVQLAPLKNKNLGVKKGPLIKPKKGTLLVSKRGRPLKSKIGTQFKSEKGTQLKSKKGAAKVPNDFNSWKIKKKRTFAYHSYWLNGLRLSTKPDDDRVMQFRLAMLFSGEKVLAPSEGLSAILDQPKCKLCSETEHISSSSYIACGNCQEWFHGEAFGLDAENISMVIGFMCHACRMKSPPTCPCVLATKDDGCNLVDGHNSGVKCPQEATDTVPPVNEMPRLESHFNGDIHACIEKEKYLDSNQSLESESKVGAENEHTDAGKKQKQDTPQNSDQCLKADALTVSNSPLLGHNPIKSL